MEEVAKKGLAKSIGISNFSKRQIERVLEVATITPANHQVTTTKITILPLFSFLRSID